MFKKKIKIILILFFIIILSIVAYLVFFKKDNFIFVYVEGLEPEILESQNLENLNNLNFSSLNTEVSLNNPSSLISLFSGKYIYFPWYEKDKSEYNVEQEKDLNNILKSSELLKQAEERKMSFNFLDYLNWDLEKKIHQSENFVADEIIDETQQDFKNLEKEVKNLFEEGQNNIVLISTNYPALVSQVSENEEDILKSYRAIDNLVAQIKKLMKPKTKLFLISPFSLVEVNQKIDINNALVYRGFLKGKNQAAEDYFLNDCDLDQSYAYSPRNGEIFINKQGREKTGLVSDDFEAVIEDTSYVLSFIDTQKGFLIDTQLFDTKNYLDQKNIGELLISMPEGYSVYWPEEEGRIFHDIIKDTKLKKEHLNIKPSLIPGFVLSNQETGLDSLDYIDFLDLIFID